MKLSILIVLIFVMSAIHIGLWFAFPRVIRNFFFANPFLALIADLAGSLLISHFTGVSSVVGTSNLTASVVFVLFVIAYNQHQGISGLCIKWIKILWIIPVIPYIAVKYNKKGELK